MEPHRPGPEPDDAALDYKDAIVLSPHKFIGGPGTPGVLVARRELFRNRVPTAPGGGTVVYVNPLEHVYLADPEHREEGGTPAIIESIRAGLAFQLKERVGSETIRALEEGFIDRAMAAWDQVSEIGILGNPDLAATVDRVVHDPPRRTVPAPQLRGGAAQRPVRHPVARRLLVRRAVRPSTARHRHRDLARVRARDLAWLRGHQARLGPGQLQLLHQRGRLRLHRPSRRSRRPRRLAAPAVVPVRTGDGDVAAQRRVAGGAALAPRHRVRRRAGCATRRTVTANRSRGCRPISTRPSGSWRTRPRRSGRRPTPEPLDVGTDFESLRWFWLPDEVLGRSSP